MTSDKKNILIDSGPLSGGDAIRGIGVYVREISKYLIDVKVANFRNEKLSDYDVVHFTSFNPFRVSVPFMTSANTKHILTIYDLIPLIYPKNYPPGIKGFICWELNKFLIRKSIDIVVTISETSKKDICRFLNIKPNKVFVTYLAPRNIFKKLDNRKWMHDIAKKYDLPARFALYVGDVNYNKNIPNLVKACKIAKIPLVIAGQKAKEIENMDLNHAELVHLKNVDWSGCKRIGFVGDEDLVKIYNLAEVYVQASIYEGFGLPLLEAFECKTPIVVSRNQCHVEILGPGFRYFDPNNINDIVENILAPNKNKSIIRKYTWQITADHTRYIYNKM